MLNRWLENEPKETLICAVTSAVSLVLSITGALKGILPFDIAWIAIHYPLWFSWKGAWGKPFFDLQRLVSPSNT